MKINITDIIKKNCDEKGMAENTIMVSSVIKDIPLKGEEDYIDLIEIIEKVNHHNMCAYMNACFTNEEIQKHGDNICNEIIHGLKPFLELKKMASEK